MHLNIVIVYQCCYLKDGRGQVNLLGNEKIFLEESLGISQPRNNKIGAELNFSDVTLSNSTRQGELRF